MSFYVTLPSNSSLNYYNNNTISEFTTKLMQPLKLNGPYEVALVEISYDHCWDVSLGSLHYFYSDNTQFSVPLVHQDGDDFEKLISKANEDLGEKLLEYESQKERIAKSLSESMEEIRRNVAEQLRKEHRFPRIIYKNHQLAFNTMDPNHHYAFFGPMAQVLDLKDKALNRKAGTVDISKYEKNFFFISHLYIYTDIIKYQYVGDTLAPLLRTVTVPNLKRTTHSIIFDSPHYVPVNASSFNTINIRITDELGNNIRFTRGKSIVKLHFRPQRYGF